MTINLKELYWAAGFLEGEGSFHHRNENGKKNYPSQICTSAAQVQLEPLERLKRIFGGRIYGPYLGRTKAGEPYFLWSVGGSLAIQIMMTLYSLMSLKRKTQIELCITAWRSCVKQKTGPKTTLKGDLCR